MIRRMIIFLCLAINLYSASFAKEIPLSMTPVAKFTSTTKAMREGNEYKFKVIENCGNIKKDEIITGYVLKYVENGFFGQETFITLGNFQKSDGRKINGLLHLRGGEHHLFQEFCNKYSDSPSGIIRGGEVILMPDKDIVTFFVEE